MIWQAAAEGGSGANFALSFEGSGKSRIFCSEHFNFSVRDGRGKLSHYFDCTGEPQTFTVYVLGEDILDIQTEIFRYRDGVAEIAERAAATLRSEERMTFSALAESLHTLSAVNVEDWKNALVEHIEKGRFPDAAVSNATPRDLEACFMPWYEYSLTVPAGGRTVSAVSSPIYPTVENTHSQLLYRYTYTLNPAQCWSKFGTLTIDIDTPYYLSESSLLGFTAREGGYTLTREKLPLGDLSFTLSAEERIEDGKNAYTDREDDAPLITAIVILGTVFAAAVTVVIVLTVQSRKRKRRREEEERRLMQARAKEGKIDI